MPAQPSRRSRWLDGLLALAVGLLDVALFSNAGANLDGTEPHSLPPLVLLGYGLLGGGALIWRRRAPVLVFTAVLVHALAGAALVAGYQPVLALWVALYTVGAYRAGRLSWLIAPALAPYVVIAFNEAWLAGQGRFGAVFAALMVVYTLLAAGIWGAGYWAGLNRRRLAAAEQQRVQEAIRAVNLERTRISGELHDIIAHAVTVMVLQAGGAQRILRADPDRAATALAQIEQSGHQAISELRRMLAVLQAGDAGDAGGGPQPGLADLPALLDRVRETGLSVHLEEQGEPHPVDPSIGLAAYRVVQEALTNVAKHAGVAARVTVRLEWTQELRVEVTDAGGPVPAARTALSTGHGLLGLRERIGLAGGRFDAGPVTPSGFRVVATMPAAVGHPMRSGDRG